jgi:hypothetical protein
VGVPAGRHAGLTRGGYGERVSDEPTEQSAAESEPTYAYAEPRPMPYGSSPYALPFPATTDAAQVRARPLIEPADAWTALLGTVGVVIVGVLAAFAWVWLSPRVMTVSDGKGKSELVNPSTKAFAGADVTFMIVAAGAGLVCALVAAVLARHRGLAVSVAMAVGGTIAALVAAWLGRLLTGGPNHHWISHATAGNHRFYIELATRPFIVVWPVTALLVTFVVALVSPDRPVEIEPTEPAPAELR